MRLVIAFLVIGLGACHSTDRKVFAPATSAFAFKVYSALHVIDQNFGADNDLSEIRLEMSESYHHRDTRSEVTAFKKRHFFYRARDIVAMGPGIEPTVIGNMMVSGPPEGPTSAVEAFTSDRMVHLQHPMNPYGFPVMRQMQLPDPPDHFAVRHYAFSDGAISTFSPFSTPIEHKYTIGFGVTQHANMFYWGRNLDQPLAPISLAHDDSPQVFTAFIPAWEVVDGPAGRFVSRLRNSGSLSEKEQLAARFLVIGWADANGTDVSGVISYGTDMYGSFRLTDFAGATSELEVDFE